jgi:class 3 adenylate cyclase
VTFDAKPLGRGLVSSLYCIASPRRSPHVRAQFVIEPVGERATRVELPSGSYEVNAVGVAISPFAAVDDRAPGPLDVYVAAEGELDVPDVTAAGSIDVVVHNALFRELIVRVEDGRWPDSIVTAAQVTALQEFRDLFSSQILAPGAEVGIESLTVLFTDLVASTALYSRSGDAVAFRLVNDHFRILRKIVAGHNGAIVKTLGDAIMAVFIDPADALEAALEMDRDVQTIEFLGRPLRLRVGLHVGPCVAIRANETIDYFGSTVNLASRLAAVAGAGEIAMSRSSAERPELAARLAQTATVQSDETLAIAGLPQPVGVVRVSSGG